jgi:hypothetical protein
MSGKAVRDTLAALGVIASMLFVGAEIRQNNVLAQAATYQALGIATSQYWLNRDDRVNRLYAEANYPEALSRWTLTDWETYSSDMIAGLNMLATVSLQVDLELLDAEALESLGYSLDDHRALATPGFVCLWPTIRAGGGGIGSALRPLIDEAVQEYGIECQVDVQSLFDQVADSSLSRPD